MKPRKILIPSAVSLIVAAATIITAIASAQPPQIAPTPRPTPGGYPAPTVAPALPTPKIDDRGLPPVETDDPFNEEDPNRTPANRLTPERIKGMLENEDSIFWEAARRDVYGASSGTMRTIAARRLELRRRVGQTVFGRELEPRWAGKKRVALTFDDGPHAATTQAILDILKRSRVPATFFFVGTMAERHPELVRAAFRDGHSIGNHTFHHVTMVKLSEADAVTEIKACGNVLKAATGVSPHLFRPPGGQYHSVIAEDAAALGYHTILWTCDPGDYQRLHPATIAQRTLKTVTPGGIILLHSGVTETLRALPYIIQSLREAGYTFVTVDEMLRTDAAARRTTLKQ
ncbi:MAG: polysaccharide deacetylase family protein [Cytophagales bacterium]|nr:polysaccharide deacetylase family protein [Armatimonadota bacterium]